MPLPRPRPPRSRYGARLLPVAVVLVGLAGLCSPAHANVAPRYTYTWTPSPVVLQPPGRGNVYLRPVTYCWTGPQPTDLPAGTAYGQKCGDQLTPANADLRQVGARSRLVFWFGRKEWAFATAARRVDVAGTHLRSVRTVRTTATRFTISAPGVPGLYRVRVRGQGPEGDATVFFLWRVRP